MELQKKEMHLKQIFKKNKLYKAVVINQIKKSLKEEWVLKNIDLSNNFKGFAIYKKVE